MAKYYASQYEKFGFRICRELYGAEFVRWFNTIHTFGGK
jgi:hypothetical protein